MFYWEGREIKFQWYYTGTTLRTVEIPKSTE